MVQQSNDWSNSLHKFFSSMIHDGPTCWNVKIGGRRKGRKVMKNKGKENPKLKVKISYIKYHFFLQITFKKLKKSGFMSTCWYQNKFYFQKNIFKKLIFTLHYNWQREPTYKRFLNFQGMAFGCVFEGFQHFHGHDPPP